MTGALQAEMGLRQGQFLLKACFHIPADGITILFGPSGSGKTTVLKILAGLRRADQGRIVLDGRVLSDSRNSIFVPPYRRGVGLVFQDARLFPHLTASQNIHYAWSRAAPAKRLDIDEVARFFDISALLERPVGNLSGGEKSRVALARALVSRPGFLLLDEPFAALDGARRRSFIQVLHAMNRAYDLPMMVVTHNIDDAAALGSHLLALANGRVVACDAFERASREVGFRALLDRADVGVSVSASLLRTLHGQDTGSVWVRADQVLLAVERPRAISARNIVEGTITALTRETDGGVLIDIATEVGSILARVTLEAADELKLSQAQRIWALVKAYQL